MFSCFAYSICTQKKQIIKDKRTHPPLNRFHYEHKAKVKWCVCVHVISAAIWLNWLLMLCSLCHQSSSMPAKLHVQHAPPQHITTIAHDRSIEYRVSCFLCGVVFDLFGVLAHEYVQCNVLERACALWIRLRQQPRVGLPYIYSSLTVPRNIRTKCTCNVCNACMHAYIYRSWSPKVTACSSATDSCARGQQW